MDNILYGLINNFPLVVYYALVDYGMGKTEASWITTLSVFGSFVLVNEIWELLKALYRMAMKDN